MQFSMSLDQAAIATGIGKTKLYEAINQGRLVAKKFGKKTIILQDDLKSFLFELECYQRGSGVEKAKSGRPRNKSF